MTALPVLHLTFGVAIKPWQLVNFRQQFLKEWEGGQDFFQPQPTSVYYTKVQFKIRHYFDSERPMLSVFGPEATTLYRALSDGQITLPYPVEDMELREFAPMSSEKYRSYHLYNYLPFTSDNHRRFRQLSGEAEQLDFLQKLLGNHLVTLSNTFENLCPENIVVKKLKILKIKEVKYKGVSFLCLDIRFVTNLFLPEYIGCGLKVRSGFGVIRPVKVATPMV